MPAYGKITLVTTQFHPSDVAFARGWSRHAPGIDGWRLLVDREDGTERVSVVPPGAQEPVFIITHPAVNVLVERRVNGEGGDHFAAVGEFPNLRMAVQALCPISEDDLQEIHEELEIAFPRRAR